MLSSGVVKRCLEECEKSTYKFRIGAVIFKGDRIISSGHNGIRSSSKINNKYKKYENSLHAEQAALMGLDWTKVKGYSILVMKLSPTKKILSNAKPCKICQRILTLVGIKNIFYSNEYGEIVKIKLEDLVE